MCFFGLCRKFRGNSVALVYDECQLHYGELYFLTNVLPLIFKWRLSRRLQDLKNGLGRNQEMSAHWAAHKSKRYDFSVIHARLRAHWYYELWGLTFRLFSGPKLQKPSFEHIGHLFESTKGLDSSILPCWDAVAPTHKNPMRRGRQDLG
jgi:hypothetical protein